jgi:beta-lactamase superfamily II metal-dependent hydrolase
VAVDRVAHWDLPSGELEPEQEGAFIEVCRDHPDHLVYFALNVGDGDTQLVLFPADANGRRKAMVVDVATTRKLPALYEALAANEILPPESDVSFCVVVATHPHDDHLGGMPELIARFQDRIQEYWEPGYYHPSGAYLETMVALEDVGTIQVTQPAGGMTRFLDKVKVTVLSPGIGLRSRFDSYGVSINDSSITLKIEFPAARVSELPAEGGEETRNRAYHRLRDPWSIILGADAQTTSWGQVTLDFPQLHRQHNAALYRELRAAQGTDPLRAHVFKVPHHASKHGVNLELVERIEPSMVIISSTGDGAKYHFPHSLAVEAIREGLQPSTSKRQERKSDHALGIHYTCARLAEGSGEDARPTQPLGSIGLLFSPRRGDRPRMWRFLDESREPIDLKRAREVSHPQRRSD